MNQSIKTLPPLLVNQIAAGEVIERPASIIKELMENAIDSNPTKIDIKINNGGKTYISVRDNGKGMTADDLSLCLQPHTTSKIINHDLTNLPYLGFRGEALASISSVAQISVATKHNQAEYGNFIAAVSNIAQDIIPHSIQIGTEVQVSELFVNVPARLKFLRTDNVEFNHCVKIFKKLALSNAHISFTLTHNNKLVYSYSVSKQETEQLQHRCSDVLGIDFINNSIAINEKNPMLHFYGFVSVPTFNSSKPDNNYFVINNRNISSPLLNSLIKVAYSEVLFNMKHPSYILFMDINPHEIDINVNPTKSEVRFKDISFIRYYIISNIKKYLQNINNQKVNTTLGAKLSSTNSNKSILKSIANNKTDATTSNQNFSQPRSIKNNKLWQQSLYNPVADTTDTLLNDISSESSINLENSNKNNVNNPTTVISTVAKHERLQDTTQPVLGYAKAQIHKNWILSQSTEGLVIIDQHAAHERIVQEELKAKYITDSITTQLLLSPEILDIPTEDYNTLLEYKDRISKLGIIFDSFGKDVIIVKAIPVILGNVSIKPLLNHLIHDLNTIDHLHSFEQKINSIIASMACHNSIRSGRIMSELEMNDLLRTLETTNNYAQCSHGRPTFVHVSLAELDKLFKRK